MTSMPEPILITVALCTHNQVKRLKRTLAGLGNLATPTRPWDIIVVDNACSDETPQLLSDPEWHPQGVPVRVVTIGGDYWKCLCFCTRFAALGYWKGLA